MAGTIELSEKAFQQMLKKIEEQGGGASHLQEKLAELKDAGIANAIANSPATKQSNKMLAQAISDAVVSGLSKTLSNVIKENNNQEKLERLITQDKEEIDTLNSSVGNLTGQIITSNMLLTDIYNVLKSQNDSFRNLSTQLKQNNNGIGSAILNGIGTALEYIGLKSLISKLTKSGEKVGLKAGETIVEDVGKTASKAAQDAAKVTEKAGLKAGEKTAEELLKAGETVAKDSAKIAINTEKTIGNKTYRWLGNQWAEVTESGKAGRIAPKDVAEQLSKEFQGAAKTAEEVAAVTEKTNLLRKVGKGAASAVESVGKVVKFIFPARTVIKEAVKESFIKRGWKMFVKKIPIIGLAAAGVFAFMRWAEGDTRGAAAEIASGATAMIPGIGTAASVAIDINLIIRDVVKSATAKMDPPLGPNGEGLDLFDLYGIYSEEQIREFLSTILEEIKIFLTTDLNSNFPNWKKMDQGFYDAQRIDREGGGRGSINDYNNQKKEDMAGVYAAAGMDLPPDLQTKDNTPAAYNKYTGTIRNDDFRNRGVGATDATGGTNITGGVGAGTSVRKETPFKTDNGGMIPIGQYKSSVNKVMSKEVYEYLKSKGLDDNHAIGMLANIQAESNFNAGAVGDNGTSGGLFQHHAGRFKNMVSAAGPDWQHNWKGQIDYALSEQDSKMFLGMNFKTPEEASAWFTSKWERPKDPSEATKRLGFVDQFKKMFTSKDATNATAPQKSGSVMNQSSAAVENGGNKNSFGAALNNNGGGGSTPPPVGGQGSNQKVADASKVNGPVGAHEHDVRDLLMSQAA